MTINFSKKNLSVYFFLIVSWRRVSGTYESIRATRQQTRNCTGGQEKQPSRRRWRGEVSVWTGRPSVPPRCMRTQDFCQVKKTRYYSTLFIVGKKKTHTHVTRQRLDQIKMHLQAAKGDGGRRGRGEFRVAFNSPPSSPHADAGAGQQARRAVDGNRSVLGASSPLTYKSTNGKRKRDLTPIGSKTHDSALHLR
jgi:hypothetical protein